MRLLLAFFCAALCAAHSLAAPAAIASCDSRECGLTDLRLVRESVRYIPDWVLTKNAAQFGGGMAALAIGRATLAAEVAYAFHGNGVALTIVGVLLVTDTVAAWIFGNEETFFLGATRIVMRGNDAAFGIRPAHAATRTEYFRGKGFGDFLELSEAHAFEFMQMDEKLDGLVRDLAKELRLREKSLDRKQQISGDTP